MNVETVQLACEKLVSKHHLAIESLTEQQLAEVIRQAIAAGDFGRVVVEGSGAQQIFYIPGRGMDELQTKYNELIYAVGQVHEGETRHETALRYILEAEKQDNEPAQEAR